MTRYLPKGKMHLLIYAKESLIKFSASSGGYEEPIKSEEIEPLLVKDIVVLAKKKAAN